MFSANLSVAYDSTKLGEKCYFAATVKKKKFHCVLIKGVFPDCFRFNLLFKPLNDDRWISHDDVEAQAKDIRHCMAESIITFYWIDSL